MKDILQIITPKLIYRMRKRLKIKARRIKYLISDRQLKYGETSKAKQRRMAEKFFEFYCQGIGIDIGYGGDMLYKNCQGFDIEDGDAHYLASLKDESYDYVYSSHTLEHLSDPQLALYNWWRILKTGGHLILFLPERDLYEKKRTLPSRWNIDHEHFFLLDRDELPHTIGVLPIIKRTFSNYEIIYAKICSEGHTIKDPYIPSDGEYSIEAVIKKL